MNLVPLRRSEVRVGKRARFDIYDPHGNKLLSRGMLVASEGILERLLERGWRDADEMADAAQAAAPVATPFDRIDALCGELGGLHEIAATGSAPSLAAAFHALAERLADLLQAAPDTVLAAFQLGCEDDTPAARIAHVCVLCELVAERLQLEPAERRTIRAAALSYDLGMHAMREELSAHPGALSPAQWTRLREHPRLGADLLRRAGVADEAWLEAILGHHERIDGSGYPRGLSGDDIGRPARILAVADIYSAMIRPRAYRGALNAREAMRTIFLERGRLVDAELAALLVKSIGMFPPGSFVRLANGEIAVVTARTDNASLPELRSVVAMDGSPRTMPSPRDPQDPLYAIVSEYPISECRFPMAPVRRLWT